MNRCCRDSIKWARLNCPTEGVEIACRWNDEYVRYERIGKTEMLGWVVHDRVGDFVKRESDPIATEAREKAYQRILGRERQRMKLCDCGCGLQAGIEHRSNKRLGRVKGEPARYRRGHKYRPDWERFYSVDSVTGCWNWLGSTTLGYARIGRTLAYVQFYERAKGPKPAGLELDHLCRNRRCVNPAHMEPVTRAENVRRGLSTKLTIQQVEEIRAMFSAGATNVEVAAKFNIGTSQASRIKNGKSWVAA